MGSYRSHSAALIALCGLALVGPLCVWNAAAQDVPPTLVSMRFRDASLDHVLEFFGTATGYTIVKPAGLDERVTVVSATEMPVDQALTVLDSILAVRGYTSIAQGTTLKIMSREDATYAPLPTRVGADPDAIPPTDTVVTQVMSLASADAAQVAKDLQGLLPTYALMTAHARSNALIITASSAVVKRFAEIVRHLDVSMSDLIRIEVFPLQYAVASDTADLITELYAKPRDAEEAAEQERAQRRGRGGFGRGGFGGGGSPGDGGGDQSDATSGGDTVLRRLEEVKAVADENTNAVVVSAGEASMTAIRDLIGRLDTQRVAQPSTRVFSLDHADASEVANSLNQAFSSTARNIFQQGRGGGGPFGRGGFGPQPQQQGEQGEQGAGVLGLPELVAVPDVRTNSV
ncbi:hypothetical protein HN371_00370, partial [Candidatus Poribacteria bacterium]|nr:hypothetical protein [Candidatus Poribacteria bacterium]